jgi:hypothetical protein
MPILLGEMVQNDQTIGFLCCFFHFVAVRAPPYQPEKVVKGSKVGWMYGPMSKLKKKAPNQILRPILLGKMVQNNQKLCFLCCFFVIWRPFGHPNGPKKVPKGSQVGNSAMYSTMYSAMYSAMYKLENKPLAKSLGPSFKRNSLKQPQNRFFILFFHHFGAIWAPPNRPKKVLKGPQVGTMYDPMSKHKNKPLV